MNYLKITFISIVSILCTTRSFAQQDLYNPDSITIIELTFTDPNWDQVMDTYKANSDNAESNCDHTYEDERLIAHCVVNGVSFDSVGVKYKGNSTYSENGSKNPLNIKIDYIKDQDYNGYETLKLSNVDMDPSYIREILGYKILRNYMAAPKSNFAQVYINGNLYGLFTSSQSINTDFARKHFKYSKPNAIIKCNAANAMGESSPSLEYISQDTTQYYCSYQIKSDYGWTQLVQLIDTINNNADNIEKILDIDKAIWMLAFNNVTINLDSYSGSFKQNYYLIWDKNNRICPVIWDLNMAFGGFTISGEGGGWWGGGTPIEETNLFLHQNDDTWPLIKLILNNPRYRKMYIAHCKTIMEEFFDNGEYRNLAMHYQSVIQNTISQSVDGYTYNEISSNIDNSSPGGMMGANIVGVAELMESRKLYYQSEAEYTAFQPEINLQQIPDTVDAFSTITISIEIQNANYAYIGYKHSKNDIFTKIVLNNTFGNIWEADITVDENNTYYYVYAENNNTGKFSPARAEYEYHKVYGRPLINLSQDIVINEFLASNRMGQQDEYSENEDWIELYNNTNEDLSLLGYFLTDNIDEPSKWAFPDTIISAHSYLIVWADEDGSQGSMHANFKLSSSGEQIAITNSNYQIIDSVQFATQLTDYASARVPNGTGDFIIQEPTFSSNNNGEITIENQTIELSDGWNLISFYIIPSNNSIDSVFSNNINDIEIIKTDESYFTPNQPNFLQSLHNIEIGKGYLVKVINETTLEVEGEIPSTGNCQFTTGWNLIGCPWSDSQHIQVLIENINTEVSIIKDFSNFYDPLDNNGTLEMITNGKGYFIKVAENSELIW